MSNQRILLVYPNERDMSLVPPVIGLFASILRDRGHTVSMFDSTGYDFEGKADSDVEQEKNLFNAPIEAASSKGIKIKLTNISWVVEKNGRPKLDTAVYTQECKEIKETKEEEPAPSVTPDNVRVEKLG